MAVHVFVLAPPDQRYYGFSTIFEEAAQEFLAERDAIVRRLNYDVNGEFRAADVRSLVLENLGPVVIVQGAARNSIRRLREGLSQRTTIDVAKVADSTDLYAAIVDAHDKHSTGEPQLPMRLVVALLIINKLRNENMWGGKNKGFMWRDRIPKGRGIPQNLSNEVPGVLNTLSLHNVLITKKSQGKSKYALNPDHRVAIHESIRNRRITIESANRALARDPRTESARILDELMDC